MNCENDQQSTVQWQHIRLLHTLPNSYSDSDSDSDYAIESIHQTVSIIAVYVPYGCLMFSVMQPAAG